jgi:hypothetical protein
MSLRLHHRERPWGVALRRVPVDSGAEEVEVLHDAATDGEDGARKRLRQL